MMTYGCMDECGIGTDSKSMLMSIPCNFPNLVHSLENVVGQNLRKKNAFDIHTVKSISEKTTTMLNLITSILSDKPVYIFPGSFSKKRSVLFELIQKNGLE